MSLFSCLKCFRPSNIHSYTDRFIFTQSITVSNLPSENNDMC